MQLQKYQILNGSMLKLIAVISMAIDHTALVLGPELAVMGMPFATVLGKELTLYYILRRVGRLAFPIFCFLVTEGYLHTRSPRKYGLRLLLGAVVSEIPFNLMISGNILCPGYQSVYVTLLLGMLLIHFYETLLGELTKFVGMLLVVACGMLLRGDYGVPGMCLILLMYLLRNHPAAQAVLSYPLLSGGLAAWAAFVPIRLYNGQRGFIRSALLTYGFYLFYPVHMILLAMLRLALR